MSSRASKYVSTRLPTLRNVARDVNLLERHADFVFETPEAGKADGSCLEVVVSVSPFEHQSNVFLNTEKV
jgi:hypothetical protein